MDPLGDPPESFEVYTSKSDDDALSKSPNSGTVLKEEPRKIIPSNVEQAGPSDQVSLPTTAEEWREQQPVLEEGSGLYQALLRWQGSHLLMESTLQELLRADVNMDHVLAVATIWCKLEEAPPLPIDLELWHASPPGTSSFDQTCWLPTSATVDGAERWAKNSLTNGIATIHKLVVKGENVRALAVRTDGAFEFEQEILLAPGFRLRSVNEGAQEQHTEFGNQLLVYHLYGPTSE